MDDLRGRDADKQVPQGAGRLPRILGDENADTLPGDVGIDDTRILDGLVRQVEGELGGVGHGAEVLGRDV